MTTERLASALAARLGTGVTALAPLAGGDINDAFRAQLADGRSVFVKTHRAAPSGMYEAEARGLVWLAEAKAVRVPSVLAVGTRDTDGVDFLALELITPGRRGPDFDDRLGRALARLHRHGAPGFGLDHDNFIGSLPQDNTPAEAWVDFLRERRLEPQLRMATDAGLVDARMQEAFARLFARLPDLLGPTEPAARLHGDLWAGNHMVSDTGEPVLIDPAVYGGHREVDLAMMRLFGGHGPRVFSAYHEAYPLAEGHEERVPLYQLYPLLVHLNLFGAGYAGQVRAALDRFV